MYPVEEVGTRPLEDRLEYGHQHQAPGRNDKQDGGELPALAVKGENRNSEEREHDPVVAQSSDEAHRAVEPPGEVEWIQSSTARSNRRLSPSTTSSASSANAHTTNAENASPAASQTAAASVRRSAIHRIISARASSSVLSMGSILSARARQPLVLETSLPHTRNYREKRYRERWPGMIRLYAAADSAVTRWRTAGSSRRWRDAALGAWR